MAGPFTGAQRRILDCLIRETLGWPNRDDPTRYRVEWRASLREWAERTCLHKDTVWKHLHTLESANVIELRGEAPTSPFWVSLNVNVDEWQLDDASDNEKYQARLQELQRHTSEASRTIDHAADSPPPTVGRSTDSTIGAPTDDLSASQSIAKAGRRDNHGLDDLPKESLRERKEKRDYARAKQILDSCLKDSEHKPTKRQVHRLAEVLRDERPDESITKRATAKARDRLASDPSFAWFAYLCQTIRGMVADQRGEQRERGLTEQRERARRQQAQREAQMRRREDEERAAAFAEARAILEGLPTEQIVALRVQARQRAPLLRNVSDDSHALWAEMIRVHRQRVGPGGADGQGSEAQ